MPETMIKHSGKITKGKSPRTDVSASVQAARATAAMYDTLSTASFRFLDLAIDNTIASESRDAISEGEQLGMSAGRLDPETGSFSGFERKEEIFKWDVALNKSAKQTFEANVASKAVSFIRKVAADSDGNEAEFKRVSEKIAAESSGGLQDEAQRNFTKNAFSKAYYQVLPTVQERGRVKAVGQAEDSWKTSRKVFRADVGSVMRLYFQAQSDYRKAEQEGDTEGMQDASDRMTRHQVKVLALKEMRFRASEAGVQLGSLNPDGVYVDVEDDIFEGRKDATIERLRSVENYDEKAKMREEVANSTELGPLRKNELLKAMDGQIELENAQFAAEHGRLQKMRNELSRVANTTIRTGVLDLWAGKDDMSTYEFSDWQQQIERDINDLYSSGDLTKIERQDYLTMLRNGDTVAEDDASVYAEFYDNIEMYNIEDITTNPNLTFATKKELTKRWSDFNENEQWMKAPAYKEGKNRIREAFGFYENTLLPQMLDPTRERQQKEMSAMIDEYRTQVREKMINGEPINHYDIVGGLLEKAHKNAYSSITKGSAPYSSTIKFDYELTSDAAAKGVSFEKLVEDFEALGGTVTKTATGKRDIKLLSEEEKK